MLTQHGSNTYEINFDSFFTTDLYFPQPETNFPIRETNSFLAFGVESGVYKESFSVGVSVAHGYEFEESDKEPRSNELDHTSYWRISGTVRKRFLEQRPLVK